MITIDQMPPGVDRALRRLEEFLTTTVDRQMFSKTEVQNLALLMHQDIEPLPDVVDVLIAGGVLPDDYVCGMPTSKDFT